LGLVSQKALSLRGLPARLIRADVAPGEFSDNWSQIPLHFRLAILVLAPLYGAYCYLTATKESIGRLMKTEDLASSEEIIRGETAPKFDEALLTRRDAKVIAAIDSLADAAQPPAMVGIMYGAAHMKAVTATLMGKYKYQVDKAEWLTVFNYDTD
jgi:hypothetical protein